MTTISTSPPSSASDEVARGLTAVRLRIERAGGDPARIRVVGVTKGFGPEAVRAASDAGLRDLGENYAGELVAKAAAVAGAEAPVWHFLGAVQRNKVQALAPIVGLWQSVAREAEGARASRVSPPGPASWCRSTPLDCRAATAAHRRTWATWSGGWPISGSTSGAS